MTGFWHANALPHPLSNRSGIEKPTYPSFLKAKLSFRVFFGGHMYHVRCSLIRAHVN